MQVTVLLEYDELPDNVHITLL